MEIRQPFILSMFSAKDPCVFPMMFSLTKKLDRLLFPCICRHCGGTFRNGLSNVLCKDCFDSITPDSDPRCCLCGLPLPPAAFEGAAFMRCKDCRDRNSPLDGVRAFAPYDGALRLAHHFFKFEGMPSLAPILGARMAGLLADEWKGNAGVLVPVPLSPDRERERGYNPSRLLAQEILRLTGLAVAEGLVKIRSTEPQMKLDRKERLQSPRGAYALKKGFVPPANVVLVDDVVTTGATLEECARMLKKGGASEVKAVLLGRTARFVSDS
jgi:competence protein ComFC